MGVLSGLELRRQLFHAFNGTVILLAFDRWGSSVGWILVLAALLGLGLSLWHSMVSPIGFADPLLKLLERPQNMGLPGRGAIIYGFGAGLALLLFCPVAAKAAVCALAYGDAASTVFGKLLGRRPIPWNRRLSWEGALAFVALTSVLGSLFVGLGVSVIAGVLGSFAETVFRIDDNLSIPLFVGCVLHLFMCG